MQRLAVILPEWLKKPLRRLKKHFMMLSYYGKARLCPVCGKSSRQFIPFGDPLRKGAQCIHCKSLERHRFLWLFLQNKTNLFDGRSQNLLHFAPESCFESRFMETLGSAYLTADLNNPKAMVKMDISDIPYPDQSFDVIYCSHVFEHVPDDIKAMRECFRVLKNDGWAILLVPITSDKTYENPSIVDPEERLKAFGQVDHVRRYGPDYVKRLQEAGFKTEIFKVCDLVDSKEAVKMGLTVESGEIFFCTKPVKN